LVRDMEIVGPDPTVTMFRIIGLFAKKTRAIREF